MGDNQEIEKFYQDLFKQDYFSCFVDGDTATNGSVKYFQGGSSVNVALIGPLPIAKYSDSPLLTLDVSMRGDPSIPEDFNKYLEEKIIFALKQIVFADKYPHLTLKIFVTVLSTEENLYVAIFNGILCCLLRNGLSLRGTCFAFDFNFHGNQIQVFSSRPKEVETHLVQNSSGFVQKDVQTKLSESSSIVINLSNGELLQLETVETLDFQKFEQLNKFVQEHKPYIKKILKTFILNNLKV